MIDWSLAIWAGLAGGVAMAMWAMAMHKVGFSRMSMSHYEGCMLTGEATGTKTFLAGMAMHLVISVVVAFVYAWLFKSIWDEATAWYGALIAIGHWLVGGMMLPIMDRMNPCVKHGTLPAMGFFAAGYGAGAVVTFLISHLLFGLVVGWIYEVPFL